MSQPQLLDLMPAPLAPVDAVRLATYEQVIEHGLQTFYDVGMALSAIRDERLYRATHATFADYCRERWDMSRVHAHRLVEAADIREHLLPIGNTLPETESQTRPLAGLEPELQIIAWQQAVETAPNGKLTAAHVEQVVREFKVPAVPLANHQRINASTNNEWYTPRRYLDAVHAVMGGIDLDPASNAIANKNVRAAAYYTIDDDGFTKEWRGRVWLNPPYGREAGKSNQARWSRRLIEQYRAGNVTQAVLLVNAVPSNQWFAPLWDFPICFTDHRIRFDKAEDEPGQPTHSNALVYLGTNVQRFADVFSAFGVVAARLRIADEVAA